MSILIEISETLQKGRAKIVKELVQKAVGNPSNLRQWSQTDVDSIENVIQSNFLRTYRNVVKRAEEVQKMPSDIKAMIQANETKLIG